MMADAKLPWDSISDDKESTELASRATPTMNEGPLEAINEEPASQTSQPTFQPLLQLEGWRGLAHYRTDSRRKVVQKKPEDRTASDLYVLEESVKNAKLISDLPLAKRLELCKYLGYAVVEEDQHVYLQGEVGSTFYVLFTGLIRASICEQGVQEPRTKVVLPGDSFGELALLSDDMIMADTAFTTERCELLTLTRDDYDKILKLEKTPEMKERVKFFKTIEAFHDVSKQSLQRLANVLHSRTYDKNKVITFQGDEAFEMFFIKSGECRIIMEIPSSKKPVTRLPRVSTFVYMDSPTIHRKCKLEVLKREEEYGRPSINISRPGGQRTSSRLRIPTCLPDTLLGSPDLIHELAMGHTRAQKGAHPHPAGTNRTQSRLGSVQSKPKRPLSAPSSITRETDSRLGPLAAWGPMSPKNDGFSAPKKATEAVPLPAKATHKTTMIVEEETQVRRPLSAVQPMSSTKDTLPTDLKMQPRPATSPPKKRRSSTFEQKYTLDTFLMEVEAKHRQVKDLDFSERDHALWHMGMSQGVTKSGFSEDVKYYRDKFQKWARRVLDRERHLFGFNVYENQPDNPTFVKGSPLEQVARLEQGPSLQSPNKKIDKDAMILDIGALQAGDYFGERGLLKKTRRAVSIVSICPVEVLVLNVWDFHRHCDRDIITALAENDYKKEEQIYKQYLKNCRWERFKRKCLDEIVDKQNYFRYLRVGPKGMRFVPKGGASNPKAFAGAEWK